MKKLTTIKHYVSLMKSVSKQSFNESCYKDYWFSMNYVPKPGNEKLLGKEMVARFGDAEVPYYFNTAMCEKNNSPVAVSVQLFNRFTHEYEVKIFVDDLFFTLSPITQKFIIAHEYGHIKLNHINGSIADEIAWCTSHNMTREELLNPPYTKEKQDAIAEMYHDIRNIKYEYEADKYAADHVGRISGVIAIRELRDNLPKELFDQAAENEFDGRIRMLNSMM